MPRLGAAGLLIAVSAFLPGCPATMPKMEHLDEIPAEVVPRLDAMPELPAEKSATFEVIGTVEGVSCNRALRKGMPASWEDAVRRTKYRALQLGAEAVANLDCGRPEQNSLATLCREAIRCTASAVRALR